MQRHELRRGRPEAAAIIWNWNRQGDGKPQAERAASARKRGLLQAVAGGSFGLLILLFWSQTLALVVFTVSSIVLLAALVSPMGLYAAIHRLFQTLGNLTGRALTWILLVPIFYLFFLPFGRLMRRGRRDRMRRWMEPEAETYWEAHVGPTASSDSRERQY